MQEATQCILHAVPGWFIPVWSELAVSGWFIPAWSELA